MGSLLLVNTLLLFITAAPPPKLHVCRHQTFIRVGSDFTVNVGGGGGEKYYLHVVPGSQLLQQALGLLQGLIGHVLLRTMGENNTTWNRGGLIGYTWKTTAAL